MVEAQDYAPSWNYGVDSTPDPTFGAVVTADETLSEFFSRPIKLTTFQWSVDNTLSQQIDPWTLFFNNKRIVNRISNYYMLRCKMKIKLVINGNGFYYGRAIASYRPLDVADEVSVHRTGIQSDVVQLSQQPHVYLDPTKSQGGTITCPFVFPRNALIIPDGDWNEMGALIVRSINTLKHANGGLDPVYISVFAWLEDVSYSLPTSANAFGITSQASEFKTHPISFPANWIARISKGLKTVPVIGPYAMATEMISSGVADLARLFGFCKPTAVQLSTPYQPKLIDTMAVSNTMDTCRKLALDCKQETTIDPRVMGLSSTDELGVRDIACRETYLTSFNWLATDSTESLLFNVEVSPRLWREETALVTEKHMTASAFASLPFRYWRGGMKFRFQIACAEMHKGRLKFVYDPHYPVTNEYNTNYTHIIDLAVDRDFTFTVGWARNLPYAKMRDPTVDGQPIFTNVPIGAPPEEFANGILSVYVVNELTTVNPTDGQEVFLNVFISGDEDIEFADPTFENLRTATYVLPLTANPAEAAAQVGDIIPDEVFPEIVNQSGDDLIPAADATEGDSKPVVEPTVKFMGELPEDNTNRVFFGDPIHSFRPYLKRYNYLGFDPFPSGGLRYQTMVRWNFPTYRGYLTNGLYESSEPSPNTPYNFNFTTLLNYLTPAYVCRRGSLRWKRHLVCKDVRKTGTLLADRIQSTTTESITSFALNPQNGGTASQLADQFSIRSAGLEGIEANDLQKNPVMEYEMPYYTNQRFEYGKRITNSENSDEYHSIEALTNTAVSELSGWDSYVAAGEDFTLGLFTGAPVMYFAPNPVPQA